MNYAPELVGAGLTRWVLVLVVLTLVLYDLGIWYVCGPQATISWVLRREAKRHPIITIAIGVVLGHIFWHS